MTELTTAIIVSVSVFIATYIGILSKKVDRTIAAISGAVAMIIVGHIFGFYDQSVSYIAFRYIDFNTLGLLLGMMIIVGLLGDTGFFEYLAVKTAKMSNGSYYRLLALFVLVTAFTSAFLDNVTTVLLMAPVTISIAKELDINPVPFLIAEVISSNIGGTATLIGDPPNIMIGSAANLHFSQFIIYLAPIVMIVLFVVLLIFELLFKDILEQDMKNFEKVAAMEESEFIKDWGMFKKTLWVLLFTLVLFTFHHVLGIEPWLVAITGASLLLLLSLSDPEQALEHVHWSTLLFFIGLFIIVGGLFEAGVIEEIAHQMSVASNNNIVMALFVVIMVSGFFAMIVGNIPAAITLIPAVALFIENSGIGASYPINPLWWALSLGACFGGNGTLISAPANLIVSSFAEKKGYYISFKDFTLLGLPLTIFALLFSFFLLWIFFVVMM